MQCSALGLRNQTVFKYIIHCTLEENEEIILEDVNNLNVKISQS